MTPAPRPQYKKEQHIVEVSNAQQANEYCKKGYTLFQVLQRNNFEHTYILTKMLIIPEERK